MTEWGDFKTIFPIFIQMAAPAQKTIRRIKTSEDLLTPSDTPSRVQLVNGIARIPYQEAYRELFAAITPESGRMAPTLRDELPAIITHWLQSVDEAPIMLGASEGARWRKILLSYAGLAMKADSSRKASPLLGFTIDYSSLPFAPVAEPSFRFIDLFAGIGGFRLALQAQGGKCVFTSEWDKHAKNSYSKNYGEVPFGDITHFTEDKDGIDPNFTSAIPEHSILAGGFPCQAFSQAGRQMGFTDARGTLFFEILKIAKKIKPEVLFLENVKRLKSHDGGNTFKVIINSLHALGYKAYAKVLRAYDYGVPQNRERIFIVAFKNPIHFEFPTPPETRIYKNLGDILERKVDEYYTISDRLYAGHLRRQKQHKEKGNGFGFSVFKPESLYTNTISARYWKDGSEILIAQKNKNPRMLTLRECARLQGYPDAFLPHDSHTQAYKQFGNSVAVPVVSAIAASIIKWKTVNRPVANLIDPFEPVIL
jgi:DNA (cytosine-5)-methyltransferase 1